MDILRVNYQAGDAKRQFTDSLKETGFAVLYNHPIDQYLIESVYEEWRQFFASDDKNNYHFKMETQDGFFPQSVSETAKGYDVKDIKEYFHYYEWGQYPSHLSDNTRLLFRQLFDLAKVLLEWVQWSLPDEILKKLSQPLPKMIENSPQTLLRILHYPPLRGDEPPGAVRAAAHGDINLLTLLVGATKGGLQVKDAGNNWQNVPSDLESIVVNIGDMLEMCTEDYYHSTLHRVVNPEGENVSRLSMPLFLHAHPEAILKPGKTADVFLKERLRELGVLK